MSVRDLHGNRFNANRLSGVDGGGCHRGYLFMSSHNNIVTANEISGCNGDAGVALLGSGGVGSTGNIIRGNVIIGSASDRVVAGELSTGNIVQANRVAGFVRADLADLSNLCDNNTWKANQFGMATPTCLR